VRDNEQRASLIGINVYFHSRGSRFVISGLLAGVGRRLVCPFGATTPRRPTCFIMCPGEVGVWAIGGVIGSLLGTLRTALLILFPGFFVSGHLGNYLLRSVFVIVW